MNSVQMLINIFINNKNETLIINLANSIWILLLNLAVQEKSGKNNPLNK